MKNILIFYAVVAFLAGGEAFSENLSDYRWQSRVVITKTDNAQQASQLTALLQANETSIKERRLLVFVVTNNHISHFPATPERESLGEGGGEMSLLSELKDKVSNANTVLIGLDGGLKNAYPLFSLEAIFRDIDGMPMRQAELKYNKE